MDDEVDFLPADKHGSFLQVIVPLWVCIARHTQSTKNNMFAISLQYLKESLKDEVGFLSANKCQRLLQIKTIISGVCRYMPN